MDYIHDLRKIIGPRKIILNCAGALIIRDDRILFQRRTDNGRWGLIGGLLEMNETYEQAALREIREETGLEVKLDDVSVYPLLPYPGTPPFIKTRKSTKSLASIGIFQNTIRFTATRRADMCLKRRI